MTGLNYPKSSPGNWPRNPEFEDIPDIEADRDSYDIICWDLEPGDVYLFHAMAVHGAGGNTLQNRGRLGYAIRCTGDDEVYDLRPGLSQIQRAERMKP